MNYVMSDIHGQYELFVKMLDKINFSPDDHLYIAGDIIDRGLQGIEIIQKIMKMDNVTLIIGNHEHMMLSFYKYKNADKYSLWMKNGGYPTREFFDKLCKQEQQKILMYLSECPIVIPCLKIGKRKFHICHASPINHKSNIKYKDAYIFDIEQATWDRDFAFSPSLRYFHKSFRGTTVIFGHTINSKLPYARYSRSNRIMISRYNKYCIGIDCGCSSIPLGNTHAQLGCLRLEDLHEFYVYKEEVFK